MKSERFGTSAREGRKQANLHSLISARGSAFKSWCVVGRSSEITPQVGIARVESARVTLQIRFLPECGYRILLLWYGTCADGTS